MLRLSPSHVPLWRSSSTLQLGTDDAVVLRGVVPWQEALLDALTAGVPEGMLPVLARDFGAPDGAAGRFVDTVHPALTEVPAELRARVELPAEMADSERFALLHALRTVGIRIVERTAEETAPSPLIVVAHRLVDPRRAAALVAGDVPHLPVELAGDRVTVGPLVIPGRTACLACLHAHRRDEDPAWPILAVQLLSRPAPRTEPALLLEAAAACRRALSGQLPERSVTVHGGRYPPEVRQHRAHADCLCRSP